MIEKFYTKTGMYIDWQQMESLPEIDTLIDIGVGPQGTEDLYRVFKNANKFGRKLKMSFFMGYWYKWYLIKV